MMSRIPFRGLGSWAWLCLALAGCSISPGNKLTLFPQSHALIDAAKDLRRAYPEPLDLPRELNKQVLPVYRVEPGDVLLVQPASLDSPVRLPADQPVLLDGTINLGSYGKLVVAGKSVEEIEADVRAAVARQSKDAGPILVRLVNRVSKVYYVLGEVNTPGSFPLAGRETVLDGILAAGGLTDRASRDNIILTRPTAPHGCRVVIPICYSDIVQLGDTSTNYQLAPGDRIYVPSRGLLEDCFLFHKKPCAPCGRPQTPCALEGPCAHPAVRPGYGPPAPVTAPVTPVGPEMSSPSARMEIAPARAFGPGAVVAGPPIPAPQWKMAGDPR